MQWLLLVVFLAALVIIIVRGVWPMHVRRKRQLEVAQNLFTNRAPMTSPGFASTFFRDLTADVPIQLRRLLEHELGFDLARLRPDDRLVADLGLGTVDGLQSFHFAHDVEEQFSVTFPEHAWNDILTFSDLVTYIAKQMESQAPVYPKLPPNNG